MWAFGGPGVLGTSVRVGGRRFRRNLQALQCGHREQYLVEDAREQVVTSSTRYYSNSGLVCKV